MSKKKIRLSLFVVIWTIYIALAFEAIYTYEKTGDDTVMRLLVASVFFLGVWFVTVMWRAASENRNGTIKGFISLHEDLIIDGGVFENPALDLIINLGDHAVNIKNINITEADAMFKTTFLKVDNERLLYLGNRPIEEVEKEIKIVLDRIKKNKEDYEKWVLSTMV